MLYIYIYICIVIYRYTRRSWQCSYLFLTLGIGISPLQLRFFEAIFMLARAVVAVCLFSMFDFACDHLACSSPFVFI